MSKKQKQEQKKKKKLAIILPLIFLGVTAAVAIPTSIVLTKSSTTDPVVPTPQPQPYTGPTFKFSGTKLLGFNDGITNKIILERFPNKKIKIPECTEIASGAFNNKIPTQITEVILPSNTKIIGSNAFANNSNISEISFYDGKNLGDWQLEELGDKAFSNTSIESFSFPLNLKKIGESCFEGCNKLTTLNFVVYSSASDIVIQDKSFSSLCKNGTIYVRKGTTDEWKNSLFLAGIVDPDVTEQFSKYWNVIEYSCLDIDEEGTCYGFRDDIPDYLQFLIKEESKELLIPSTVKKISNAKGGFQNNEYINKLILSSSVVEIEQECFMSCANLQTIDATGYLEVPKWTGNNIFTQCPTKGVVVINNKLRKKWINLFEKQSGLKIGDDYWKVGFDEFALENCICIKSLEGTTKISLSPIGTRDLKYMKNNSGEWIDYSEEIEISAENNDVLYFKGNNPKGWSDYSNSINIAKFYMYGGSVSLAGNIMGLINNGYECKDEIPCDGCFYQLFMSCKPIIQVSEDFLTPTTLKPYCYYELFHQCFNLINIPSLPAPKMAEHCYERLASFTSKLQEVPALNSIELAEGCYMNMFSGCSKITTTKNLPATTLQPYCYQAMFSSCASLIDVCELKADKVAEGCYKLMFISCGSLVNAPDLIATKLQPECYSMMFCDCNNLNNISVKFTSWLDDGNATSDWLKNVASTGTFNCSTELAKTTGSSYIPENWTINTNS